MRRDPARRAWPLFALAVLIGFGALVPFALQAYRDIRITYFYRPATCSIVASRIVNTTTNRGGSRKTATSHPELTYQLPVDGRWYTAEGFDNMGGRTAHPADAAGFERGKSYPCWYDPWHPEEAVLRRQVYKPFYLGLAIPAIFLLVGGSMLSRALRPVPEVAAGAIGRGEALAVRLAPEMTGRRAVGCIGMAVVVWSAGVIAFFAYLVRSERLFSGDGLTSLAFILAAIDVFMIYHLTRFIRGLGVAEPVVEIDREPLHPGDTARIFVRQPGPARFAAFKVSLICEEQGQKGLRKAHSHMIVNRKGVDIAPGSSLTESASIEIPAGARLSLKELQTIVTWKIVVQRDSNIGGAEREFVFRVSEGPAPHVHADPSSPPPPPISPFHQPSR